MDSHVNLIKLSSLIRNLDGLKTKLVEEPEAERIHSYMTAGDEARNKVNRGDFIAALAVSKLHQQREKENPLPATAHILISLKHPDEVELLRNVYGGGFYLLGINSSRTRKLKYFKQKGIQKEDAKELIKRDESEEFLLGQQMRDAFHLSDGFIDIDDKEAEDQISRILDLIFGKPWVTPTKDEYGMYLAFAASLRSADLSRQIGAIVTSATGEVIATGANDVPCFNGGLYWSDGQSDHRDYKKGYDSNERRRNDIVIKIMKKFDNNEKNEDDLLLRGKELLRSTGILDITEYGRAVHAEMEALLSCSRSGVSPRKGTLYTTTFPCHNCAKHIVAVGISRVVFVEPYPKSLAIDLHSDTIRLAHEDDPQQQTNDKVSFEPFMGVGPRRFMDLFSMNLSSGKLIKRKEKGVLVKWNRENACVRVPLLPISYIEKEIYITSEIDKLTGGGNGNN